MKLCPCVAKTIVVKKKLVWKYTGYVMVVKLSPCVAKNIVVKKIALEIREYGMVLKMSSCVAKTTLLAVVKLAY